MKKDYKNSEVKEKSSQELKEEILNKVDNFEVGKKFELTKDGLFVEGDPTPQVLEFTKPAEPLDLKMEIQYTPWKLEQLAIKAQEKIDNKLELAYYYKETHNERIRNVPVYTAKRLLEIVRKEGKEKHGDNYVTKPKSKHKKSA